MTLATALSSNRRKAVAALAALALAIALPYVVDSYYVSLAGLVLIAAILASSVNILAGSGGMVSLGHAGIAAAAAYGVAWASHNGHGMGVQLALAAGVTLAVSAVYGLVSMRTNGIFFLMVTLALGMTIFGLAYRLAPITGGENGLSGITRPAFVGPYWVWYFLVLGVFVLTTAALWVVARSPFGTVLRGIRDSETRMLSLGYHVTQYKFAAMMVSGVVAGIAGVLSVWHTQFVSPSSASFGRSALTIVMVILGGVGATWGPLIGAAIVIWVEHVLSTQVERWPTLLGLVFILVILFAPSGVMGAVHRLTASLRRRRGGANGAGPPAPTPDPRLDKETAVPPA